jgi:hypothetical protein
MTERARVTAPNAEAPTWTIPPDALLTPLVMPLACFLNVSSESLPPLTKLPTSLCLTLSTRCGRSWLNPRTAPLIACTTTSKTAPMTTKVPTTSTGEDSFRLQWNRRSIKDATGNRTATLKTETKTMRRTFAIDANAHARATTPATSRIVWTEIETSSLRRPLSLAREGSAALIWSSYRLGRMTYRRVMRLTPKLVRKLHARHHSGSKQQPEGDDVAARSVPRWGSCRRQRWEGHQRVTYSQFSLARR